MTGLDPNKVTELAEMLSIMGEPNRLRIILACLDTERAVGALAADLDLSPSLVSHHLRLLRAARILRGRRAGKNVFYTAADSHVRSMVIDMTDHVMETSLSDDA